MQEGHLRIGRTARYFTLGAARPDGEVWFLLHGYGQQADDFLEACAPLDDGSRLLVAPEALSRFYVGRNPDRVGASWMTRVDREREIADYVAYLDRLCEHVAPLGARIMVLGFSQGAATASRWVGLGLVRPSMLVLWGGAPAHDLDLEAVAHRFRASRLTFVTGSRDTYVTAERLRAVETSLISAGIEYEHRTFEGGHRIDRKTLLALAGSPEDPGPG